MADEPKLHFTLVTHDRQLLDTACDAVELPGSRGQLGILPGHTPLIATLKVGEVMYRVGKREQYLALTGGGFCEVADDRVTVLTEQAELPEEIDVAEAEREVREAEAELHAGVEVDWQRARARLENAMTRAAVGRRSR